MTIDAARLNTAKAYADINAEPFRRALAGRRHPVPPPNPERTPLDPKRPYMPTNKTGSVRLEWPR